jgi:hypothetical protein
MNKKNYAQNHLALWSDNNSGIWYQEAHEKRLEENINGKQQNDLEKI